MKSASRVKMTKSPTRARVQIHFVASSFEMELPDVLGVGEGLPQLPQQGQRQVLVEEQFQAATMVTRRERSAA